MIAPKPDPISTLHEFAENEKYDPYGLKIVSQLSSADFEKLFRSVRGRKHRNIIRWFKGLRSIVFSNTEINVLKETIQTAGFQALETIASGSDINRRRVDGLLKSND